MRWMAPALAFLLGVAPWAAAQNPDDGARDPGAVHLRMDEVEIRGEVERPDVFYIIPRREVQMDLGTLSKDYRSEILEPLLPGPFEEEARRRATGRTSRATHP